MPVNKQKLHVINGLMRIGGEGRRAPTVRLALSGFWRVANCKRLFPIQGQVSLSAERHTSLQIFVRERLANSNN